MGLRIWRTARDGGNDFLASLGSTVPETDAALDELSEQLKETAARLGGAGDDFLDACRRDLQD